AVRAMKEQGRRPLRTLGSLALSRSLLRAGLVDRYRVVVFPVITGVTGRDRISTGIPTSPSNWWTTASSTAGCRCSRTARRFSPGRRAPGRPRAPEDQPDERQATLGVGEPGQQAALGPASAD